MKCLLTGAKGFLGSVLAQNLDKSVIIKTLSRSSSDYRINLSSDIPKFNESFDIVIHAAGLAHITPKSKKEIDLIFNVNSNGTRNLLIGLEKSRPPRNFILISTVAVYGKSNGNLIKEDSELKAVDPYGRSKIEAENFVIDWCQKYDVICTILRLPLVVGLNAPGNLGSMIKSLMGGFYFNIAGSSARKSMVLASDVAKFVIRASQVGGIYNLTDGYHPSFFEFSRCITSQLGKGAPITLPFWLVKALALFGDLIGSKAPINTKKLRKITSNLTFDDSQARRAFGWDPTPVLDGFKISDINI